MGEPIDPDLPYLPGEHCDLCWDPFMAFADEQTPSVVMVRLHPETLPSWCPRMPPDPIILPQVSPCRWRLDRPDGEGWYGYWLPNDMDGSGALQIKYNDIDGEDWVFFFQETAVCKKNYPVNTQEAGGWAEVIFADVPKAVYLSMMIGAYGLGKWEFFTLEGDNWWFKAINSMDHTCIYISLSPVYSYPYHKNVTGTINPNWVGDYDVKGLYGVQSYARRKTGGAYLWWDAVDSWILSAELGVKGDAYHERALATHQGTYNARGTATGQATVHADYA